jgi:RES domain.
METDNDLKIVACSDCFFDQGLHLDAKRLGLDINVECPICNSKEGKKITIELLDELAYRFLVWGSLIKCEYGAFPEIQYNPDQTTSIELNKNLKKDITIFEKNLGVGFFYYGPRAWMYGEVEPLKELKDKGTRAKIIKRILSEYPEVTIASNDNPLYRIRKEQDLKFDPAQFDSPPNEFLGSGRFDYVDHPILYASQDLELCIHEMRVTTEDDLYVATLQAKDTLRFLDLSIILKERNHVTEFESLDMAVSMLFFAGQHAYEITREIGSEVKKAGFDGIVYPSYFSCIRNGGMPYQTVAYGISNRRIPEFQAHEESIISKNIAVFGYPIQEGKIIVKSVNKLVLTNISYNYTFGPVQENH